MVEAKAGARIADRYVLLGDLGAGGMGVVLRARDERLGRSVAVKLLPKDTIGDEAARKRLLREARASAALDHPNIVHVYDVGETPDGGAYLVMELVKGRSLGEHLRAGTLSRVQRLAALVEVAHALQYAHDQGFLHRDIKPDNLMVRDDGRVVVLDFGLAKAIAPGLGTTVEASLVSSKSTFVGTPAYVSPEQARGDSLDPKTDQFSLAVSMFEMLTGELPWEGGTPLEVISHILRGSPKKLRAVWSEASEELEAVFDRALEKSAADRFPSMSAFADAIAQALPELARPPSLRDIGTGPAESAKSASIRTLSAPVTTNRVATSAPRSFRVPIIATAAVVAIGGVAWFAASHATKPVVTPSLGAKSVIACPVLRATDPDLGDGATWLGAAAGALVCDRVQAALGGDPERTRVPAELLSLPHEPREKFPEAPFESADVIEKSMAEAKRADAWIDGAVEHAADFHVTIALHEKNDVIERGDGRGPTLLEAVRSAMTPIVAKLEPAVDDAYARKWFSGATTAGRLAAFDLHVLVLAEDLEGERAACTATTRADLGTLAPFYDAVCAKDAFEPIPPLPAFDATSPGAALTTAAAQRFAPKTTDEERRAQRDHAAKLEELANAEHDLGGKALLLAAAADIHYASGDNKASATDARASIQASPKIADLRGNAWHRQSFVSEVDNIAVLAAHTAWLPWEPYAWPNLTRAKDLKDLRGYQRGYLLAQRGWWAVEYGVRLLQENQLVAARGVVAKTHNPRLEVLLMHAEHRPGAALDYAIEALRTLPAKAMNGNTAARLASNIIDLGTLLGRSVDAPIADYVNRFMLVDPPALTHGVTTLFGTISVCTQAKGEVAQRCIDRLGELYDRAYFGGAVRNSKEAVEGARRYIGGDLAGAAKVWRPIADEFLAESMRVPMAMAFERAGDTSLADKLDDIPIAQNTSSPETELCWVRKALRAEKRGDLALAQQLAKAFVDRWESADERPQAVTEMKRVLARTK